MSQTLKSYIPKVLSENKIVLLQGVGTLRMNYRPAVIDEGLSVMTAPREEIYFVPGDESALDPVLVKIVEMIALVDHDEATDLVQRFMQDLQKELRDNGFITLPNVGWIKQDNWGNLFFEPAAEYIEMNSFFGFGSIELPEALSMAEQEALADLKKTASEQSAAAKLQREKERRRWGFIISALALLVILGVLYLTNRSSSGIGDTIPTQQPTSQDEDENLNSDTLQLEEVEPDSLSPAGVSPPHVREEGPNYLPVLTSQKEVPVAEETDESPCIIIVGAFGLEANVDRMKSRIEEAGYPSVEISGSRLTKVGLRFDCSDSDGNALNWAQQNLDPNAWIFNEN